MRISYLVLCLACAGAAYACSESTGGVVPPETDETGDPDAGNGTGNPPGAPPGPVDSGRTQTFDATPTGSTAVLFNEIAGDDEWIEIVNPTKAAVDLSGFKVADSVKDGGAPKLEEAVTFPANTVLSPNTYLIVKGGGLDDGGKPCPTGGQSYCFNAEFGISNKNGETLFLVDGTGAIVASVVYPPAAVDAGSSWGRMPSGDPAGTFQPTAQTPGATNTP